MNTIEFNVLLHESRNGGNKTIGASATRLQELLSKMTVGFLKRKNIVPNSGLVDDLVGALFVLLLKHSEIPKGYTWNSWFWYAIKTAWAEYCANTFSRGDITLSKKDIAAIDWMAPIAPIPVIVNARMMNGKISEHLQNQAVRAGPRVAPDKDVWLWAAVMLIKYGKIQNAKNASVRSGLSESDCRLIIMRAAVKVRMLFEALYGQYEQHTIEECAEARELANKLF